MGHIFVLKDLESGNIPYRSDYDRASFILREGIQDLVNQEILYGALFFGSYEGNLFEIGSDIDTFLISRDTSYPSSQEELIKLRKKIHEETNILVQLSPHFNERTAKNATYRVAKHFIDTLSTYATPKNIIGQNPITIIKPKEGSLEKGIENEMGLWLADFFESYIPFDSDSGDSCRLMKRSMHHVIYTTLNMLHYKNGELPVNPNGRLVSPEEFVSQYKDEFPGINKSGLDRAIDLKKEYRDFLLNYQKRNSKEYISLLKQIYDAIPDFMIFIRNNVELLANKKS